MQNEIFEIPRTPGNVADLMNQIIKYGVNSSFLGRNHMAIETTYNIVAAGAVDREFWCI